MTDAVVYALSISKTKRAFAKEGIQPLNLNNVKIVGIVITQLDLKKNKYGYSYSYAMDIISEYDSDDIHNHSMPYVVMVQRFNIIVAL